MGVDVYLPVMWGLGVMALCLMAYRFLIIGRRTKTIRFKINARKVNNSAAG